MAARSLPVGARSARTAGAMSAIAPDASRIRPTSPVVTMASLPILYCMSGGYLRPRLLDSRHARDGGARRRAAPRGSSPLRGGLDPLDVHGPDTPGGGLRPDGQGGALARAG